MKTRINNSEIELIQGDITESNTDAIVNAANSELILGGGVAGAIRKKGGPAIQEACNAIGHCAVGDAAVTPAGHLNAKYVIHAVGPRWGEGDEQNKLRNATLNSLKRADEKQLTSITFPALSTGIFGFPMELAAEIMIQAVKEYLSGKTGIQKVFFCLFDQKGFTIFRDALES
jgi:O-acetyl-ADP-ribose deacetylase (regulator of RNase III)